MRAAIDKVLENPTGFTVQEDWNRVLNSLSEGSQTTLGAYHRKVEIIMKFSLGAIQYYWPKDKVERFYRDVADSPVDIVYMGETVCSNAKN